MRDSIFNPKIVSKLDEGHRHEKLLAQKKIYIYMHKCINMYQQKTGVQALHAQGTLIFLSIEQKNGVQIYWGGVYWGGLPLIPYFLPYLYWPQPSAAARPTNHQRASYAERSRMGCLKTFYGKVWQAYTTQWSSKWEWMGMNWKR